MCGSAGSANVAQGVSCLRNEPRVQGGDGVLERFLQAHFVAVDQRSGIGSAGNWRSKTIAWRSGISEASPEIRGQGSAMLVANLGNLLDEPPKV